MAKKPESFDDTFEIFPLKDLIKENTEQPKQEFSQNMEGGQHQQK